MKKQALKTIALTVLIGGSIVTMSSCKKEGCTDPSATNYNEDAKKDDGSCTYEETPTDANSVTKSGTISSNETWTADKIWILDGKVVVADGVTLTIEPGTIVKGKEGQESLASALVVSRGGKLMAEGTASKPIIFTSILDNIQIGEQVGTNLARTDNQKWGGVVILGKAPISAQSGDTESNIEGIPVSAGYGLYGGSNATDNSGTLKYVSIRHGGISIGEGNELNGLTLGGVGSGTTVDHVEVYATLDDGIEFFGGTVNPTNILIYFQGDDGLDIDQNYAGTIDGFMVIHGDGVATDKGLEVDGPEGTTNVNGMFTLRNGLVKSLGTEGAAADFKDKAQGTIENVTFDYSSMGGSVIKIRASYDDANGCASLTDALTHLLGGTLTFTNSKWGATAPLVYTGVTACSGSVSADQTAAEAMFTEGAGSTITTSGFAWTCASLRGQL